VDLNLTPEEVLHNIGPRTRKHIRSGLRKGNVVIETLTQKEHLADWYGVIQKTYLAARVPLADYALFEAAFDHLHAGGMIKFWLARLGDAYVAASVELLYKQTMYGWYGGVDRAYSREVPGELIMWHILKWGAENGYHVYDFGGAGKPDQEYGVRDFKAKFGGNLVDYGRDLYIPNPALLRVSTLGYQIYQKLLSRP
jgi:lipid II:glycine glycyltransferase (peptidoglycan interpeptide bridge formation enzyme)